MADAFISFAHSDQALVAPLVAAIEAQFLRTDKANGPGAKDFAGSRV